MTGSSPSTSRVTLSLEINWGRSKSQEKANTQKVVKKNYENVLYEMWVGVCMAKRLAYLFLEPTALGSIPGNPKIYKKILILSRLIDRPLPRVKHPLRGA